MSARCSRSDRCGDLMFSVVFPLVMVALVGVIVTIVVLAIVDPHAYELLNGQTSVTISTGGKR